jgi:hypothetical protein
MVFCARKITVILYVINSHIPIRQHFKTGFSNVDICLRPGKKRKERVKGTGIDTDGH